MTAHIHSLVLVVVSAVLAAVAKTLTELAIDMLSAVRSRNEAYA